jgi:hypothetical protein
MLVGKNNKPNASKSIVRNLEHPFMKNIACKNIRIVGLNQMGK